MAKVPSRNTDPANLRQRLEDLEIAERGVRARLDRLVSLKAAGRQVSDTRAELADLQTKLKNVRKALANATPTPSATAVAPAAAEEPATRAKAVPKRKAAPQRAPEPAKPAPKKEAPKKEAPKRKTPARKATPPKVSPAAAAMTAVGGTVADEVDDITSMRRMAGEVAADTDRALLREPFRTGQSMIGQVGKPQIMGVPGQMLGGEVAPLPRIAASGPAPTISDFTAKYLDANPKGLDGPGFQRAIFSSDDPRVLAQALGFDPDTETKQAMKVVTELRSVSNSAPVPPRATPSAAARSSARAAARAAATPPAPAPAPAAASSGAAAGGAAAANVGRRAAKKMGARRLAKAGVKALGRSGSRAAGAALLGRAGLAAIANPWVLGTIGAVSIIEFLSGLGDDQVRSGAQRGLEASGIAEESLAFGDAEREADQALRVAREQFIDSQRELGARGTLDAELQQIVGARMGELAKMQQAPRLSAQDIYAMLGR